MAGGSTAQAVLGLIDEIFSRYGADSYLGEAVTMADHMLQAAALASEAGAGDGLIAAALLHDIGHYLDDRGGWMVVPGLIDHPHDQTAARLLALAFPETVVAGVSLHVAAKRYLCATESDYAAGLSPASILSFAAQGGPMNMAEIQAFQQLTYGLDAVRLRRFDDAAKVVGRVVPGFSYYRPLLQRLAGA